MNFISKLIALFHGHSSKQPLPDVIVRVARPDYGTNVSAQQMCSDYRECYELSDYVRQNHGEDAHKKYIQVLVDLLSLIQSKERLEAQQAAESEAREKLDAAYATQQGALN